MAGIKAENDGAVTAGESIKRRGSPPYPYSAGQLPASNGVLQTPQPDSQAHHRNEQEGQELARDVVGLKTEDQN